MHIRLWLLLTWSAFALIPTAAAQPLVDGFLSTRIVPGAGTGGLDQLEVQVQLAARGETFALGNANLMFFFNDEALAIPSAPAINTRFEAGTDYRFEPPFVDDPGNGRFYLSGSVTLFGATDRISVNVVLDLRNQGQTLPMEETTIATLFFDIIDGTQTADLQWILAEDGDPNPTVVQQHDNQTEVVQGIFEDTNATLPVELVAFTGQSDGEQVILRWETASETNNAGFEVQVRDGGDEASAASRWAALGFVEGAGTTAEPQAYVFTTARQAPGTLLFRLKQVDFDGSYELSPQVEVSIDLAQPYLLTAPYPNPVAREAHFSLRVKRAQQVEVAVYDALGRKVRVLFSGTVEPETERALTLSGAGLQSGMYFVRAVGETFVTTQRALVVK